MLGDLYRHGFDVIQEHTEADAIVINTCGFVEDAKTESIEAIIEASSMKSSGKVKKVIVTGCLAQRYSEDLAGSIPIIPAPLDALTRPSCPDAPISLSCDWV